MSILLSPLALLPVVTLVSIGLLPLRLLRHPPSALGSVGIANGFLALPALLKLLVSVSSLSFSVIFSHAFLSMLLPKRLVLVVLVGIVATPALCACGHH